MSIRPDEPSDNEGADTMNHHDHYSSKMHYERQTRKALGIDETKYALDHYTEVANQALAQKVLDSVTEVAILEVADDAVMAWMDCHCGDQLTAFGVTEASALRNLSGELFAHEFKSITSHPSQGGQS